MKQEVDESIKFLDGEKIPSILIQNKCDLIDENEYNKCDDVNKSYCKENNFDGCFMCSVKEGTIMSSASKNDDNLERRGLIPSHAYTLISAKKWKERNIYYFELIY